MRFRRRRGSIQSGTATILRNARSLGACRALAFEPRVRACFEIKALSPPEGWLPFKDLATQRSEQERVRGDVKPMRDTLLGAEGAKRLLVPFLHELGAFTPSILSGAVRSRRIGLVRAARAAGAAEDGTEDR